MTQTTPSHSQSVEAAVQRLRPLINKAVTAFNDWQNGADPESELQRLFDAQIAARSDLDSALRAELTSQQEVAAPVGDVGVLSWNGFNVWGDEKSIKEVKECIHAKGIVPQLQQTIVDERAASRVPVASLASREQGVEAVGAVPVMDYEHQRAVMEGHRNEAAEIWQSEMDYTDGELRAFDQGFTSGWDRGQAYTAPPSSKTQDDLAGADNWTPEEIEAVICCLDDDAAAMLNENDEDERAHNMQRAATMIQVFSDLASQPKAPAPVPVVQGEAIKVTDVPGLQDAVRNGLADGSLQISGGAGGDVGADQVQVACITLNGSTLTCRVSDLPSMFPEFGADSYALKFKTMTVHEYEALGDFDGF